MAEQGPPQPLMSAPFPAPPPFFKHFTSENIAKVEELQKTHTESAPKNAPLSYPASFTLPPDLRAATLSYHNPPLPPPDGAYRLFGQNHNVRLQLLSLRSA